MLKYDEMTTTELATWLGHATHEQRMELLTRMAEDADRCHRCLARRAEDTQEKATNKEKQ